ncbi:MAG TPA: hypothetical protein VM054_03075 [bacterium]|nr:hypothetical protein [bacterium]
MSNTEKESKPYQIRNPFTLKRYENLMIYFQSEITSLTQRTTALLSISIAIIAAPFYITFLQIGKFDTVCFDNNFIYSLCFIGSLLTSFLSIIFLFWSGFSYLETVGPYASFNMEIPSDKSITDDYQENKEIEIYKLYRMAILINNLLNFYNYKLSFYGKGIRNTKISVIILLFSILLTVVSSFL